MKKRYIIAFTGLFESGYVILSTWQFKPKEKQYNNIHEAKKDATYFRFKFIADFYCWFLNKASYCSLRQFTVIECDIPKEMPKI